MPWWESLAPTKQLKNDICAMWHLALLKGIEECSNIHIG